MAPQSQTSRQRDKLYEVWITNNFVFDEMDEEPCLGGFHVEERDALLHAQFLVDFSLHFILKRGMTAEDLYCHYLSFGHEAYIAAPDGAARVHFNSSEYALVRCLQLPGVRAA